MEGNPFRNIFISLNTVPESPKRTPFAQGEHRFPRLGGKKKKYAVTDLSIWSSSVLKQVEVHGGSNLDWRDNFMNFCF